MKTDLALAALTCLLLTSCSKDEELAPGDGRAEGQTTFRDAGTKPDGTAREPATPEEDDGPPLWVEVVLEAAAEVDLTDPRCSLDGLGSSLEVLYSGEATLSEDGAYVASFASADAEIIGAPECTLPDLSISAVTGVSVQGWYETTTQRCESYCEASARAEAEEACEGDADEVSCRAEAEAEHQASCSTSCEDSGTWAIYAETALDASQVADVSTSMIAGEGLGAVSADLRLELLVDADGDEVAE